MKKATCRPSGAVFLVEMTDEAGRTVQFHIQVDSRGVSCWTDLDQLGGRLSPNELYAACVMKRSGVE